MKRKQIERRLADRPMHKPACERMLLDMRMAIRLADVSDTEREVMMVSWRESVAIFEKRFNVVVTDKD